ncbi:hypothetical protein RHGRI_025384 [Rhododendron griersonianum]|uniref:Uncharacterized protein n=1 Tax=Rhododendron griersonianum TaxID=479676 RepID=A0AAV6IS62_9ERIC|nr:hypothetical protein RHGRI_025384 [Rhododendron griersonianum]
MAAKRVVEEVSNKQVASQALSCFYLAIACPPHVPHSCSSLQEIDCMIPRPLSCFFNVLLRRHSELPLKRCFQMLELLLQAQNVTKGHPLG